MNKQVAENAVLKIHASVDFQEGCELTAEEAAALLHFLRLAGVVRYR